MQNVKAFNFLVVLDSRTWSAYIFNNMARRAPVNRSPRNSLIAILNAAEEFGIFLPMFTASRSMENRNKTSEANGQAAAVEND